ncbi:hypothetical protein GGI43DRAFT_407077 [Trichoderma evansii]
MRRRRIACSHDLFSMRGDLFFFWFRAIIRLGLIGKISRHVMPFWCAWVASRAVSTYVMRMTRRRKSSKAKVFYLAGVVLMHGVRLSLTLRHRDGDNWGEHLIAEPQTSYTMSVDAELPGCDNIILLHAGIDHRARNMQSSSGRAVWSLYQR